MDALLAERLQLEELSCDDDTTLALALQLDEYLDRPAISGVRPQPNEDTALAEALQRSEYDSRPATLVSAQQRYDSGFPRGRRIIPTPGTNLRCGLYAIILSYRNQYPSRTEIPTLNSLIAIVNSPSYLSIVSRPQQASNAHEASIMATSATRQSSRRENLSEILHNDRYFSPDQLDLLLRLWGEQRGLKLRLGYVRRGNAMLLSRGAGDEAGDAVWIDFDARGKGHYSGIAARR